MGGMKQGGKGKIVATAFPQFFQDFQLPGIIYVGLTNITQKEKREMPVFANQCLPKK